MNCTKEEKNNVGYNYPPIKIPEDMRETKYSGYYITRDGRAYRKPGKYDKNGKYGHPDENGLIYLKPAFRGHARYRKHQYKCINISIRDENNQYKQIKKSIHQLVAEVFVPNPFNYSEIDHIDRNKLNNHYTNLRWVSRFENASEVNAKSYTIKDTITGKVWTGMNMKNWVRENYEFISSRMIKKDREISSIARDLSNARSKKTKIWNLIVKF